MSFKQCTVCQAIYGSELNACPECQPPVLPYHLAFEESTFMSEENETSGAPPQDIASDAMQTTLHGSTLIEFPVAQRAASRPQWRAELSERVREIQERRAREAAREAEEVAQRRVEQMSAAVQLGLVPPRADAPTLNPLVAAALRRIERAHQTPPPPSPPPPPQQHPRATSTHGNGSHGNGSHGGAATAVARAHEREEAPRHTVEPHKVEPRHTAAPRHNLGHVAELVHPPTPAVHSESISAAAPSHPAIFKDSAASAAPAEAVPSQKPVESNGSDRSHNLVIVGAQAAASTLPPPTLPAEFEAEATTEAEARTEAEAIPSVSTIAAPAHTSESTHTSEPPASKAPRRVVSGVVDDALLARLDSKHTPIATIEDWHGARASLSARATGAVLDLVIVAFISSPFAAVIELTNSNWSSGVVKAALCSIFVVVMFLYLTASFALAGRTMGMSFVSLRVANAGTGSCPTTKQAVRRTLAYMLSLAPFGLGALYALFDAETRALHDYLSRTVVVRE